MASIARRILGASFATALMFGATQAANAQDVSYPQDTVTLVTHSSPGGGTDVLLREIAPYLSKILGANFVVENNKKGHSAGAMAEVAQAKPDGSKFYGTTPTFVNTSLLAQPEYAVDDLEPLVNMFLDPELLYVSADSPYKSLGDFLDAAKKDASSVKFGVSTPASLDRQAVEKLQKTSGVDVGVVTHDGGGDLLVDVLNGTVDVAIGEVQELRGQIEAGKVRLIGVFTDKRLEEFPDVPTVKEQGVDMVVNKFRGLAGPKDLPDDVVAAWEKAIPILLDNEDFQKWYKQSALIPTFMDHEEYASFMADYVQEQKDFFSDYGITSD